MDCRNILLCFLENAIYKELKACKICNINSIVKNEPNSNWNTRTERVNDCHKLHLRVRPSNVTSITFPIPCHFSLSTKATCIVLFSLVDKYSIYLKMEIVPLIFPFTTMPWAINQKQQKKLLFSLCTTPFYNYIFNRKNCEYPSLRFTKQIIALLSQHFSF